MKFDPIERTQGHQKVSSFLERIGFDSLSPTEKIARLKSMSYEDFLKLTESLNRQLRTINKKAQSAEDDGETIFVKNKSQNEVSYIAPKNAKILLREFFEKMKTDLDESNIGRYSIKLFYAIVFAHIFADGNGRTGRYLQRLLVESKPSLEDAPSSLENRKEGGPELVNQLALFELFKEEQARLPDTLFIDINTPRDIKTYTSRNSSGYGFGYALRNLAIIRSRPGITFEEVYKLLKDDQYDELAKDSSEKALIDEQYEELARALFWKVQELLDKEPDIKKVEQSFRQRIKDIETRERERLNKA